MTTVKAPVARYCAWCANGHHRLCTGQAPAHTGSCQCADRGHDPDVQTAAAMRCYTAPDRVGAPVEVLATEWRQSHDRVAS